MEFDEFVARGVALMAARDTTSWELGDLAAAFEVTVGRPREGEETPTLADLAGAWNVSAGRVSEWRSVSAFYPSDVRTFELPWEMYNQARRKADGDLDNALELLDYAQAQAFTVASFRRFLGGTVYEGVIQRRDFPAWLQALLPPFLSQYWVSIKRVGGE